jgi:hypothetical protein
MILYRLLATADRFRDNQMLLKYQKHGTERTFETQAKAEAAARAWMLTEPKDLGPRARCWIEKERHGKRGKIRGEVVFSFGRGERGGQNEWVRLK